MKIVKQDERERLGRKAGRAWQTTKGASSLLLVRSVDLRESLLSLSSSRSFAPLESPVNAADYYKSRNDLSISKSLNRSPLFGE